MKVYWISIVLGLIFLLNAMTISATLANETKLDNDSSHRYKMPDGPEGIEHILPVHSDRANSGNESSYIESMSKVASPGWPHYGYDGGYTSYNLLEKTINVKNVNRLKRIWGLGCNDGYFSVISRSPAIYDGKLYVSGAGTCLTAHDARTGQLLWHFGNGNFGWAPQPVSSEDGIILYMEGFQGLYYLYAVDARNGGQLWKSPLGFEIGFNDVALPTIDENRNLIYLVENLFMGDGRLFALDKNTGNVAWVKSTATDGVAFEGDYVLLKNDKIFCDADGQMIRINASSRLIDKNYNLPHQIVMDIRHFALCNNVLLADFSYEYSDLDPTRLLVAYNIDMSPSIWQKEFTEITGAVACNTTRNRIYVPTDPFLVALDANTGQEVWRYTGYGDIYNPSVANGVVYFVSDTHIYALDENTGRKLFSYPLGYEGYESTQVAIANGMLYFSGNGGTCDLYALGLPTDSIGIFRSSIARWYLDYDNNGASNYQVTWGASTDIPVAGDWDGDGKDEIGLFRPSTQMWYLDYDNNGASNYQVTWGASTDIPVAGDWDGDGKDEIGLFRPSTQMWYLDYDNNGASDYRVKWGASTDKPVAGDWDGDGKDEIGFFRPSTKRWYLDYDNNGASNYQVTWGASTDIPVAGDWDGDGKDEIGLFRPSTQMWYLDYDNNGASDYQVTWGASTDKPVAGCWS
jgi:outer membrane protein assembly factor BamB